MWGGGTTVVDYCFDKFYFYYSLLLFNFAIFYPKTRKNKQKTIVLSLLARSILVRFLHILSLRLKIAHRKGRANV